MFLLPWIKLRLLVLSWLPRFEAISDVASAVFGFSVRSQKLNIAIRYTIAGEFERVQQKNDPIHARWGRATYSLARWLTGPDWS